uniref:Male-enhanced antigen 1 n=1 Tax=Gopherus agassizii TaxID=38772 RepID=A0A452HKL7_9SAUR
MATELVAARTMGPERICPNEHEELGPQEVPEGAVDPPGDWSSEEPEEEEEGGSSGNGYFYQPLSQDPELGSWDQGSLAAEGTQGPAETAPGIQERLQMLRLHLPDPPVDSEEEEDDNGAAAQSSRSSIPMDPGQRIPLTLFYPEVAFVGDREGGSSLLLGIVSAPGPGCLEVEQSSQSPAG